MGNLIKKFLKYFYRLLIFKVIVIDRENFINYEKLKTFCEYELTSNMGPMRFIFKEDRRRKRRKLDNLLLLNSFLVELKVPAEVVLKRQELNDKVIIVIKLVIFKIDYEILSEVLLDLYVDTIFTFIEKHPDTGARTFE